MKNWISNRVLLPLIAIFLLLVTGILPGCQPDRDDDHRIGVIVSILPQAEFVEAIGGEKVKVDVMVPPGYSPHTYEPTPSQMTAVEKADIYASVGSGVEFEIAWLDKLLSFNPDIKLVDCSKGIDLIRTAGHSHNDKENHNHTEEGSYDPHIWLSLLNAKKMVHNIYDGLADFDPENEPYYQDNLENYLDQLDSLHNEFSQAFEGLDNRVFMIHHPSMGYFARDYDLIQLPIEDEGKEPTMAGLDRLIRQAREHNVNIVFTSPQFNPESAEVIAGEINGAVVGLDGLARDYTQNMQEIAESILEALN